MQHLIDRYQLAPHPEGGFYREIFRSDQQVLSYVHDRKRNAMTHIYFLLPHGQVSSFHKVVHDEIWNFYEGAPLKLITLDKDALHQETIGGNDKIYAAIVRAGTYQAAESTGNFSLVGCTVSPGFDFHDFSFLRDDPFLADDIKKRHPVVARFI